jgi:hypothetical protein
MADDRKWCWGYLEAERVDGPFDSREEAIEDAKATVDPGVKEINVGRCNWADSGYYAKAVTDMDDLIERMEEHYVDNECYCDDSVFEVADPTMAEKVLKEVVRKWAEKYLKGIYWCMSDHEKVILGE